MCVCLYVYTCHVLCVFMYTSVLCVVGKNCIMYRYMPTHMHTYIICIVCVMCMYACMMYVRHNNLCVMLVYVCTYMHVCVYT